MSSPSPLPDHLRSAQSTASTFRNLTWNLTIPVEVSLATGPSVQGQMGSEKGQAGQVYGSTDIGGRGGIAGGVDRYYVSDAWSPAYDHKAREAYNLCRCNALDIPTYRSYCQN